MFCRQFTYTYTYFYLHFLTFQQVHCFISQIFRVNSGGVWIFSKVGSGRVEFKARRVKSGLGSGSKIVRPAHLKSSAASMQHTVHNTEGTCYFFPTNVWYSKLHKLNLKIILLQKIECDNINCWNLNFLVDNYLFPFRFRYIFWFFVANWPPINPWMCKDGPTDVRTQDLYERTPDA